MLVSDVVRKAVAADGSACAAIVDRWIKATPWMVRSLSRADLEVALTSGLPLREAYVVGDPVAGYLSMDPEECHIWGLYVGNPGRGLGRLLLNLAKTGRDYLQLNTHLPNHRAHAFYRREGFIATGAPWIGTDGIAEIRMEWRR